MFVSEHILGIVIYIEICSLNGAFRKQLPYAIANQVFSVVPGLGSGIYAPEASTKSESY